MTLPLRSTVIKTDQALIIVSPVDFTEQQLDQIRRIGPVTDIVAPSMLHHLYVQKAFVNFPDATLWAAPGLKEKRKDIPWHKTLTSESWIYKNDIDVLVINGIPKITEVVLFCRNLETLIVMDLCFNLKHIVGVGAFIVLHLLGNYKKFAVSRAIKFFLRDQLAFEKSISEFLKWNFQKIVMSHGDIVSENGKNLFIAALHEKGIFVR